MDHAPHAQGPAAIPQRLAGEKIHRSDKLELYAIDRVLVSASFARLDRRAAFSVSSADRELFVVIGDENLQGPVDGARNSLETIVPSTR